MNLYTLSTLNSNEIIPASLAIFAVIDPLGSIPICLKFKSKLGSLPALKITFFAGLIMMIFLFTGQYILAGFSIGFKDFSVAGACVLFILGLEMVLNIEIFKIDTKDIKNAFLTPVAFPIIVGPGTLTTLLALQADYKLSNIVIALAINLFCLYVVLRCVTWIEQKVGKLGIINILHKIMGIVLLSMAVKLFKTHFFS